MDRNQHLEHGLVRQVDHHTIRDDCKRKVISQVKHGSAGRFRISHLWGRLTEVGSSHVLFRGHDASTPSSVRNSDGGAAGSMGNVSFVADRKSKLHAKPSRFT